jgi:hypothetical protein
VPQSLLAVGLELRLVQGDMADLSALLGMVATGRKPLAR